MEIRILIFFWQYDEAFKKKFDGGQFIMKL